jgi:hypothetical protein
MDNKIKKRNIKNLILYKDFNALYEMTDRSYDMTPTQKKISTISTQKGSSNLSKSNATLQSFIEKGNKSCKKFPELPMLNFNNLSLNGMDSTKKSLQKSPHKISLSLLSLKKEPKSILPKKQNKEILQLSAFTSVLSTTNRQSKPKALNYTTGSKYLLPGPESVYKTSTMIKQKVQGISSLRPQETTEIEEIKPKVKVPTFRDLLKNRTMEKIKSLHNRKNPEIKLFLPTKGMSYLKRTVELQLEDPYFFLNKFYGRNEAVEQKALLINLFNRNREKLESRYINHK